MNKNGGGVTTIEAQKAWMTVHSVLFSASCVLVFYSSKFSDSCPYPEERKTVTSLLKVGDNVRPQHMSKS